MKKLALLFLILPLPALAASAKPPVGFPPSEKALRYIAKAETYCRANDRGPTDSRYTRCVNGYLQDTYGITLGRDAAGSLRVAKYPGNGWPAQDATSAFTNNFSTTPPPPPPSR